MKISELIEELKKLKKKHGDLTCFVGGDYESKVAYVYYENKQVSHYEEQKIQIRGY